LIVGKNGSDSEYTAVAFGQSGFCLDNADEATGMFGLGFVAEERPAQEMSEAGGGLPQAPQLSRCSPSITVMYSSRSGSEFVDQRLAEETLVVGGVSKVKMVNSPLVNVKVGGNTEEVILDEGEVGASSRRAVVAKWRLGLLPRVRWERMWESSISILWTSRSFYLKTFCYSMKKIK